MLVGLHSWPLAAGQLLTHAQPGRLLFTGPVSARPEHIAHSLCNAVLRWPALCRPPGTKSLFPSCGAWGMSRRCATASCPPTPSLAAWVSLVWVAGDDKTMQFFQCFQCLHCLEHVNCGKRTCHA